jgi:hypothetical protein
LNLTEVVLNKVQNNKPKTTVAVYSKKIGLRVSGTCSLNLLDLENGSQIPVPSNCWNLKMSLRYLFLPTAGT